VVIVTANYRVNIFGFPGYSQLPKNPGLLDQRMAVEWVRDNIVGFGGSPAKITLVGQSAGGSSVDYYSYIWKSDPIVHGLISQSGTALSFDPNTAAQSEASFYNASVLLGCGSSGDVLPCVRNKSSTEVLAAIAKIPPQPSAALPAPLFQPTIDEETIFSNYSGLSSAHAFSPIPYLAGNNDNEYGYYAITAFALNETFSGAQTDLFNIEAFTCPTARETDARSAAGVPAWRYRYFGDWPNLQLYPGSGAYHGSEINMVFGTAQDVSGLPSTEEENQLSLYMMAAWAAFADDPAEGLSKKLGWPTYNSSAATLVGLGYANETRAIFIDPAIYDQPCQFLGGEKAESEGAF
jgi:carboxylesterase type B